jgi:hypothetical protein
MYASQRKANALPTWKCSRRSNERPANSVKFSNPNVPSEAIAEKEGLVAKCERPISKLSK